MSARNKPYQRQERLERVAVGRFFQYLTEHSIFFSPEKKKERIMIGKKIVDAINHPNRPINEEVFIADLRAVENIFNEYSKLNRAMAKALFTLQKGGADIESRRDNLVAINAEQDELQRKIEVAKDFFKRKTGKSL